MHVGLAIITLLITYWKGDWRNLPKYGLTIYYMIACNLLYNLFCSDYLLWEYKPDVLFTSRIVLELIYTFITLPSVTLLYLTHFPYRKKLSKQMLYMLLWIIVTYVVFLPFINAGALVFHHGYEQWMDLFFYIAMYSMLRLHHTRPFYTYCFSILIIIFLLWRFNVPFY